MKKVGGEVFSSSYYYILAGTTLLFFHDPRVAVTEAWIPPLLSSQSSLSCSTLGIHQAVARSHPSTVSSSCHSWTFRLQATSDSDGDADEKDESEGGKRVEGDNEDEFGSIFARAEQPRAHL